MTQGCQIRDKERNCKKRTMIWARTGITSKYSSSLEPNTSRMHLLDTLVFHCIIRVTHCDIAIFVVRDVLLWNINPDELNLFYNFRIYRWTYWSSSMKKSFFQITGKTLAGSLSKCDIRNQLTFSYHCCKQSWKNEQRGRTRRSKIQATGQSGHSGGWIRRQNLSGSDFRQ